MKKMISTAVFLLILLFMISPVQGEPKCVASQLSNAEAQQLLRSIPDAITAEKAGGKIFVTDWNPGTNYKKDLFYFFFLRTNGAGAVTTPLENGIIGYYAINKITGQVFNGLPSFDAVEGKDLTKLLTKIRAEHCVSKNTIAKYKSMPPVR